MIWRSCSYVNPNKSAPNYGEAQANLGYALERQGNLESAIAEYTKKLPALSDLKRSFLSLELGLSGRGVLSAKNCALSTTNREQPKSVVRSLQLGSWRIMNKEMNAGAIAAYRETVRLNPIFAAAYVKKGQRFSGKRQRV